MQTGQEYCLSEYIKKLMREDNLCAEEVKKIFEIMVSGKSEPVQVASLLTLLYKKGESADEIFGFAKSMFDHALKIYPHTKEPAVDTCGTGGDALNTINISTASAFVLAAAGIPVAKHGNRSVTSRCGSADLLESLGINIGLTPEKVCESIEKINIGFMFAPAYHPAMKHIAPIRRNLPFRTVFNLLGPLVNPAGVKRQITGVFHPNLITPMITALKKLGSSKAFVFSGETGTPGTYIDEVSPLGKTYFAKLEEGEITRFEFDSRELGMKRFSLADLQGSTSQENARVIENIFRNRISSPIADVIKLNSAAGLFLCGKSESIEAGFKYAHEIIQSGKPAQVLDRWRDFA